MKTKRLPEIQHKFNKQADAVMVELQKVSTMISLLFLMCILMISIL